MFRSTAVAGDWSRLVERLDAGGITDRWTTGLPQLAGIESAADLPAAVNCGPASRADEVFGALVRLAAADGGDDPDAVLVLVHLLADGASALAGKFVHRTSNALAIVVAELTCQIRSFPWRRRTNAIAAGLLLDTKHALLHGEFRPVEDGRANEAVLVDPARWAELIPDPGQNTPDELALVDLLVWAAGRGVSDAGEIAVMFELMRDTGWNAQQRAATTLGLSVKTVRRRRDRAVEALKAAAGDYLAAVA